MSINDIRIWSLTFKGDRESNQDSFLKLALKPDVVFLAVADGMGGVEGGERASKLVIECCEKIIRDKFSNDDIQQESVIDLKQILRKIFAEAQRTIKEEVLKKPQLMGMGTTLSCVLIKGDKYVWGNIGDSRIYHYDGSKLKLITKDHTYIQEFIEKNNGQVPQKIVEKYSNFLTRAIDGGNDEADIYPEDKEFLFLKNGELFLLCSDGLIIDKSVDDSSLFESIIFGTKNLEDAAIKLKNMAYDRGSTDNITIVLLEKGNIKRRFKDKEKKGISYSLTNSPNRTKKNLNLKFNLDKFSLITLNIIILITALIVFLIYNNSKDFQFESSVNYQEPKTDLPDIVLNENHLPKRNLPLVLDDSKMSPKEQSKLDRNTGKQDFIIPNSINKIDVPNVKDMLIDEAIKKLEQKGFVVKITTLNIISKDSLGRVISQKQIPNTDTVILYVEQSRNM